MNNFDNVEVILVREDQLIGNDSKSYIALACEDVQYTDITHQGELMIICKPKSVNKLKKESIEKAYTNQNPDSYICLERKDAENIISMLNEAIDVINKGKDCGTNDDMEAFGDRAISYERLIDRLDGLLYPICNSKTN